MSAYAQQGFYPQPFPGPPSYHPSVDRFLQENIRRKRQPEPNSNLFAPAEYDVPDYRQEPSYYQPQAEERQYQYDEQPLVYNDGRREQFQVVPEADYYNPQRKEQLELANEPYYPYIQTSPQTEAPLVQEEFIPSTYAPKRKPQVTYPKKYEILKKNPKPVKYAPIKENTLYKKYQDVGESQAIPYRAAPSNSFSVPSGNYNAPPEAHGETDDDIEALKASTIEAAETQYGGVDSTGSKKDNRLLFQIHGLEGPHSYKFGFDTGKG